MDSEVPCWPTPEFAHVLGKVVASHITETREGFDTELKEMLQRHEHLLLKLLDQNYASEYQVTTGNRNGMHTFKPARTQQESRIYHQPSGDLEDVNPEPASDLKKPFEVEEDVQNSVSVDFNQLELTVNDTFDRNKGRKVRQTVVPRRITDLFVLQREGKTRHVTRLPWWRDLDDPHSSLIALRYNQVMNPIILVSVALSILSKYNPPIVEGFDGFWTEQAQFAFDIFFGFELLLRFCVAYSKCNFLVNPYNITDMLASFPNLLLAVAWSSSMRDTVDQWPVSTQAIRFLCPLFKVCKILRRFPTFHLLVSAFEDSMEALPILMFVFGFIGLTFASLLFIVETRNPNPTPNNITTFQQSIWMTIITMTTVGYGDYYPGTPWGRFFVGCLVVIQVLYMALPLGILGQEFTRIWCQRHRFLAIKRIRTRMTALSLTFQDIPDLFKQFGCLDGTLDPEGFRKLCDALGIKLKIRQMKELYESLDYNSSHRLECFEFSSAIFPKEYMEQLDENEEIKAVYSEGQVDVQPSVE